MVESESDSMTNCASHGRRVPSPKLREHAHSLSHESVSSKAACVPAEKVANSGPVTHAVTAPRHSSSPYLRYHWSMSATTHSSPDRDMTIDSGSQ